MLVITTLQRTIPPQKTFPEVLYAQKNHFDRIFRGNDYSTA